MNRDVQEGCANGLYRVCTQSSNKDDDNMSVSCTGSESATGRCVASPESQAWGSVLRSSSGK